MGEMATDLAVRCTLSVGQLALGRRIQRVPDRQVQHHAFHPIEIQGIRHGAGAG